MSVIRSKIICIWRKVGISLNAWRTTYKHYAYETRLRCPRSDNHIIGPFPSLAIGLVRLISYPWRSLPLKESLRIVGIIIIIDRYSE